MKQTSTMGMHEIDSPTSAELDDANLARMGKRPVLKVDPLAYAFLVNRFNMKYLLIRFSGTLD
jgi:hypothetical protein